MNSDFALNLISKTFSPFVTTSPDTHPAEVVELPLKFEDIVDATTYDKMRPPRPGGEFFLIVRYIWFYPLFSP